MPDQTGEKFQDGLEAIARVKEDRRQAMLKMLKLITDPPTTPTAQSEFQF